MYICIRDTTDINKKQLTFLGVFQINILAVF